MPDGDARSRDGASRAVRQRIAVRSECVAMMRGVLGVLGGLIGVGSALE